MSTKIEGDFNAAQEVLAQLKLWDLALSNQNVDDLLEQCAENISMFDVSSQLNGIQEYRTEWEKFSPYFFQGMEISRRDLILHASSDLVVLHCHSKVEHSALKGQIQMPWCRTTLCMQKRNKQWYVVHQHISMPVDLATGKAVMLKDKPKLRLVV